MKVMDRVKEKMRSWLEFEVAQPNQITIKEELDFETTSKINQIWYRGKPQELEQLYQSLRYKTSDGLFWNAKPSYGNTIRKTHSGLPSLIVDTLVNIIISDMNEFVFANGKHAEVWKDIEKDNNFKKVIKSSFAKLLYCGDGAYRISMDPEISSFPIIEFFESEKVELTVNRGRVREVIFKTKLTNKGIEFMLHEVYGYGYINYHLYKGAVEVPVSYLEDTKNLEIISFDKNVCLAKFSKIYDSAIFEHRGKSIYDSKLGAFDSFDEAWSQWMDAIRASRPKTYIPEDMLMQDPITMRRIKPNPYDNQFIAVNGIRTEITAPKPEVIQPDIKIEALLQTYMTALDQCLQGIISPSTLGIDVKKLDNSEAQREKEKATLYTRNNAVEVLGEVLPEVIQMVFAALDIMQGKIVEQVDVSVPFGEYANPSFESQVETIGKGKTQGIMSIEASVEELYGDTKDKDWKAEEVSRLKNEQGIIEMVELAVNNETGGNLNGTKNSDGKQPFLSNEQKTI